MNPELASLVDLEQWAERVSSRQYLPILLRRLILTTAEADVFRAPGGDAVGDPGWDIVIDSPGGAKPYVPDGASRWEGGVSEDVYKKAQSDFTKRTRATTQADQEDQTFVFFTPMHWADKQDWIDKRNEQTTAFWADVQVIDGEDLATWLETQPAVHIWVSELLGRHPSGVTPLSTWWERWSNETSPPLPTGLVTAGRLDAANELLGRLVAPATVHVVESSTSSESIAFVASALQVDLSDGAGDLASDGNPAPRTDQTVGDPAVQDQTQSGPGIGAEVSIGQGIGVAADVIEAASDVDPSTEVVNAPAVLRESEAEVHHVDNVLFAASVLVHTVEAWARLSQHTGTLLLIPTFGAPYVDVAVAAGHHVVVATGATRRLGSSSESLVLPRIDIDAGRESLKAARVDSSRADDIARGARRNLTGLRRRLSNVPTTQEPGWSRGAEAAALVPLILAGAWDESNGEDLDRLLDLTGSQWRALSRTLQSVVHIPDSPLKVDANKWEFTDIVDAWQVLAAQLTTTDLRELVTLVDVVLLEPDPALALAPDERHLAAIRGAVRQHSRGLREGVVQAVALMGSVVGDNPLQDGVTGQEHADRIVRRTLASDDPDVWLSLGDLLPDLAEASPSEFLTAVERVSAGTNPPVAAMFDPEAEASMFATSRHIHLLWALERLTYSNKSASRSLLLLAQLVEVDPGGKSLNRPLNSLAAILNVIVPTGVVNRAFRADTLDLILDRHPVVGWELLRALVPNTVSHSIQVVPPPQWRDWTIPPHAPATHGQIADALADVSDRVLAQMGDDAGRISQALYLLQDLPARATNRFVAQVEAAAPGIPPEAANVVAHEIRTMTDQHHRMPEAPWAMDDESLATLESLATTLDPTGGAVSASFDWFSWYPQPAGVDDDDPQRDEIIGQNRARLVLEAHDFGGLDAVLALASTSEATLYVGHTLAALDTPTAGTSDTATPPSAVLDREEVSHLVALLPDQGADGIVARSYIRERSRVGGASWVSRVLADTPQELNARVLASAVVTAELLALVDETTEPTRSEYWAFAPTERVPDDVAEQYLLRLLEADRPWTAIAVVRTMRRAISDLDTDLLLAILRAPTDTAQQIGDWIRDLSYAIGVMIDTLLDRGVDVEAMATIDFTYMNVTHHARAPRAVYRNLEENPAAFVDIVKLTYVSDTTAAARERKAGGTDPDTTKPTDSSNPAVSYDDRAFRILHQWPGLPLHDSEGVAVAADLDTWVDEALYLLADADRARPAHRVVGQALSSRATDADGTWPCEAVRDVIERLADEDFDRGLSIGRYNARGATTRAARAGGQQERALAHDYKQWADRVRTRWPRTAALLDALASEYGREARRNDRSSEG